MRSRIVLTILLTTLFVVLTGCSTSPNCPTCGTTKNGAYAVLDVIPVPEHNNTGEPGGPFNSFDISYINAPPTGGLSGTDNLDYVSDRIGIAVQVIDTNTDLGVYSIAGQNGISGAGNNASSCANELAASSNGQPIPPIVSVLGNWTRFGCRTGAFHIPGFGSGANAFGGFTGAQCCAARANGINPLSGPDGIVVTPDGNTLFVGNGSSSVVAFDLASMNLATGQQPNVIADIPTGLSPDYDGEFGNSAPWPGQPLGTIGNTTGIAGCAESANGRAFSDPSCGDLRGDEISYDPKDQILAIINGDPGSPFITFIDVSGLVVRPITSNCLPVDLTNTTADPLHYGPPLGNALGPINPSTCILGQIYYDGAGPVDNTVVVDQNNGFACPDASNPQVNTGVSGAPPYITGTASIPCHHGPILDFATGIYDPTCNPAGTPPQPCIGAISPAGLGAHVWDPGSGYFLLTNANSVAPALNIGSVDVINPKSTVGPIIVGSMVMPNCMPGSIVQGPGETFLVGCADHDGEAFPANEYIIDLSGGFNATTGFNVNCASTPLVNCVAIYNVGGVDEVWYNPGDNKYYLAARDMLPGPVMGVIDAGTNQWLVNLPVNTNAHSIAVDPNTNHVFMPQQAGAICGTQSGAGCIDVIGEQ